LSAPNLGPTRRPSKPVSWAGAPSTKSIPLHRRIDDGRV
jgi:hypothetical protein